MTPCSLVDLSTFRKKPATSNLDFRREFVVKIVRIFCMGVKLGLSYQKNKLRLKVLECRVLRKNIGKRQKKVRGRLEKIT